MRGCQTIPTGSEVLKNIFTDTEPAIEPFNKQYLFLIKLFLISVITDKQIVGEVWLGRNNWRNQD